MDNNPVRDTIELTTCDISGVGFTSDTLQTVSGCDSLIELSLKVNAPLESVVEQTICAGDTIKFYNFVLTTTNTYMVMLQTDEGCDSMVIMNLQVLEGLETTIDTTICPEDSLSFGELTLSETGTYTQMMVTTAGCDSLVTLNLAIGTAGENTRTDRMGMLLLISPPGYGKTTLMEYIANRLGLIFMKINGPAIGHQVISIDPADANNMAAKQELEKLNLALEMGDNVMLYLDDIQHCNPEFLQKFISLCDGQRKIEGVYKGVSKTYDLRGKKVCVVMAGNPYTESGDKFQIPVARMTIGQLMILL